SAYPQRQDGNGDDERDERTDARKQPTADGPISSHHQSPVGQSPVLSRQSRAPSSEPSHTTPVRSARAGAMSTPDEPGGMERATCAGLRGKACVGMPGQQG